MSQGQVTVAVASGSSVSDTMDARGGHVHMIAVPALTSGDLFVQGSFESASGSFTRILLPVFAFPTSGDLKFATGPGSRMIMWPQDLPTPSFIRLETSVAQAAPRSFTVRFGHQY